MHQGHIEARSDGLGKGTELRVTLPVAGPEPRPSMRPEDREKVEPARTRRVLVADDNEDLVESLAVLLRITGNEVATARNGAEAVETAERFLPDLVLLDIGMPTLDGYAACRRIREQPWGQAMEIVALSGWGHDDDRRRSREAGFDQHLVKPVGLSAIQRLLAGQDPGDA